MSGPDNARATRGGPVALQIGNNSNPNLNTPSVRQQFYFVDRRSA